MKKIFYDKITISKNILSFVLTAALIVTSITVSSNPSHAAVRVKSITLNEKKLVLHEGEKAKLKVVKVKPKKAKKAVYFKSSKKSVASVNKKGVVTAKKAGSAKITAISKVNKKVKKTVKVTVLHQTDDAVNPTQSPAAKPTKKPYATPTKTPYVTPSPLPDTQPAPTAQPSYGEESSYPEKVLELVNKERAAQGLGALVLDTELCKAADIRANETITLFSHTRPDGTDCFTALDDAGISYRTAGENIAYGYRSPEQVMDGWMNSEGHRANILKPGYGKLGVGYVTSGGTAYWVQMFTD